MSTEDTAPTLVQVLERLHRPLSHCIRQAQFHLMDRRPEPAQAALQDLNRQLSVHIEAEEQVLLPAYAQAVPNPGRGAGGEVFDAEHRKLERLLAELIQRLGGAGVGPVGHDLALELLEAIHPLKALMHHHERREERLLAPALDGLDGDVATGVGQALARFIDGR